MREVPFSLSDNYLFMFGVTVASTTVPGTFPVGIDPPLAQLARTRKLRARVEWHACGTMGP
jgi:hypothetical protein